MAKKELQIISAEYDFGTRVDTAGEPLDVSVVVRYTDGSTQTVTDPKEITKVGRQLAAQQKELVERFIETNFYVHSDKESGYEIGKELGLEGDALREFCYTGYEVTFKIVVDRKTGLSKATHVNGVALTEPVKI